MSKSFLPVFKLSENLRALLASHRLTQTDLARRTKISAKTIHNWCVFGPRRADLKQLKTVAAEFKITVDQLCFESVMKSELSTLQVDLLQGTFEVTLRRIQDYERFTKG